MGIAKTIGYGAAIETGHSSRSSLSHDQDIGVGGGGSVGDSLGESVVGGGTIRR